jgi:uncharacterized YccA/Bax inhibitor family protein
VIRSGNPALKGDVFGVPGRGAYGGGMAAGRPASIAAGGTDTMTIQGTATKSLILVMLTLAGAFFTWREFFAGNMALVDPLMMAGWIGGFAVSLITIFKKTAAPITAPLYAVLQGLALGGLSAVMEARYPGIPMQAVGLTFAVFLGLLLAYKSRLIRATENFKLGIAAVTMGLAVFYLITFVGSFFGLHLAFLHEGSPIGIGFSAVVCVIAALNLVMDFDFIENGEANRAPKYLEWYGAFGLLVTLIWLYVELLRLLSKLNSRR